MTNPRPLDGLFQALDEYPECLTKQDVCKLLNVPPAQVQKWVSNRQIAFLRMEKKSVRFTKSAIREFLTSRCYDAGTFR